MNFLEGNFLVIANMLILTYQESMRMPGSIEQSHKPAAGKGKSGTRNYFTNNHYVNFDITQKNMLCHIDHFSK